MSQSKKIFHLKTIFICVFVSIVAVLFFTELLATTLKAKIGFDIYKHYIENVRGSLVAPFVTTGSFLLSFIVIVIFSLKEKLIDSKIYTNTFYEKREFFKRNELRIYTPIINIGRIMCAAILLCYMASISQYTIAFIASNFFAALSISITINALFMVIYLIVIITRLINEYLKILENTDEKQSSQ